MGLPEDFVVMPNAKLTQKFIDGPKAKAEAGAERTIWWDTGMEGFGLQITASGARSFVCKYRIGSISRRMKLGRKFLRLEAEREKDKNGNGTKHQVETASPLDNAKAEAIATKNAITGRARPANRVPQEGRVGHQHPSGNRRRLHEGGRQEAQKQPRARAHPQKI
jgi:hypothetical protein